METQPISGHWTHVSLHVRDLGASIAFYEEFTSLRGIEQHSDKDSTGMEVVWLGEDVIGTRPRFVLVLMAGTPLFPPGAQPQLPLGPLSHLGFAVSSRAEVDAIASRASARGILRFGPKMLNVHAGYLCIIADPDGHNVEFSHGQKLGP